MQMSKMITAVARLAVVLGVAALWLIPAADAGTAHDGTRAKRVIAHRGASGHLPEHTLASKAMAHAMGAHFIEQDVVLTRDDHLLVLHDRYLDTVTDVAERFPGRKRSDGRYYAIDFAMAEIRTLRAHERVRPGTNKPVYAARFPAGYRYFDLHTLEEEINLIQALNRSTRRHVGLYVEIKAPAWHRRSGKDITKKVLEVLHRHDYRGASAHVYVQCFDPAELRRIRFELKSELPLVQLIADNSWQEADADFDRMRTPEGLAHVATYANGIGPWINQVLAPAAGKRRASPTNLVRDAHAVGLSVHPFTARADALPPFAESMPHLLNLVLRDANADGVFTDFPDLAIAFLNAGVHP